MTGGKETEAEKRKQEEENDAVSRKQKRARASDDRQGTEVTDDEVEEFFAIIRRIHVAVDYIKNVNGKLTWESNVGGIGNGVKGEVKENVGLDLNADPSPEEGPI